MLKLETTHRPFYIKNDILAACIGLGGRPPQLGLRISGFQNSKNEGYALLIHFLQEALGLSRLPYCCDRIYHRYLSGSQNRSLIALLKSIDQHEATCIIRELRDMYDFVQQSLAAQGLKEINLRRNISVGTGSDCYGHALFRYLQAKRFLGHEEAVFEMDMLNSFTTSAVEYSHLGDVIINTHVPAADVLYNCNLISHRGDDEYGFSISGFIEGNEWVVINREINGLKRIKMTDIELKEERYKSTETLTERSALHIIDSYEPIELRGKLETDRHYSNSFGLKPTLRAKLGWWLLGIKHP